MLQDAAGAGGALRAAALPASGRRPGPPSPAVQHLATPASAAAVRRLALSQGLSYAGRGAAMTALVWALYASTGSAWWVSGAMLGVFGVSTLASPWTGHAGDRHDRRRVVVASALAGAAGFAACGVLEAFGLTLVTVAVVIAVACTQSALSAAVQGAVPNLVGEAGLGRANSLVGALKSAGFMLGPGLGGGLLAVTAPAGVFAAAALMLAVSAALMVGVAVPFDAGRSGVALGGRLDGYRHLIADPWLRLLTVAWTLVMIGVGPVIVAEVVLARHFQVGSAGYGLISVFWDGGGIVGALAGRRLRRRGEARAVLGGCLAIGAGLTVVGLTPVFWPVLAGMLVAGSFDAFGTVAAQNLLQRRTPDRIRSRVSAALDAVVLGAMAASFALGAPLLALLGAQGVYLAAAGLAAAGALVLLPGLRRSGSETPPASPPPTRRARARWAPPRARAGSARRSRRGSGP